MTLLIVVTFAVTIVAAMRSTWSPCGLSMLSTITPLTERGRGHRYAVTVSWFLLGAVAGGITLGAVLAVAAVAVGALDLSVAVLGVLAFASAAVAAASDTHLRGFRLPAHRRQVDEVWLTGFRPWVYGLGFGWQIGVGLATYITTSAVYLACVLAALTGSPIVAFVAALVFGTVRGLAVLLGARLDTPAALRAFHARLDVLDVPAARLTSAALVVATVVLSALFVPWWIVTVVAVALVAAITPTGRAFIRSGELTLLPHEDQPEDADAVV